MIPSRSAHAAAWPSASSTNKVVKADFEDPESLRGAFQGVDAVFAVTDFWKACGLDADREVKQGKNLVDAAKAEGVKHFVWSTLEDTRPLAKEFLAPVTGSYTVPHFDGKAEVEAYLREQLPGRWSCILTSVFYENLAPGGGMDSQKQADGSFVIVLPVGDAKLAWCSTSDIGNVAGAVIAGGVEKFGEKTVPVAGDHLTYAEAADTLSKVTGKKVIAITPPADPWVEQMKGYGVPEAVARDLANMCVYYDKVGMVETRSVEATKAVYPQVQSMEAWLKDHKQKFLDAMA